MPKRERSKFEREYEEGLRKVLATSSDWKYVNKKYQENYIRKMVADRMKARRRVQRLVRKFGIKMPKPTCLETAEEIVAEKKGASKRFHTGTLKGLKAAERYKNRLNNKYDKVTVTTIGLDWVRIDGKD